MEGLAENLHLFKIYYSKEKDNYYLKDMGEGPGVFVRIDKPIILQQGAIISFGQHHLVFNFKMSKEIDKEYNITVQTVNGEKVVSL